MAASFEFGFCGTLAVSYLVGSLVIPYKTLATSAISKSIPVSQIEDVLEEDGEIGVANGAVTMSVALASEVDACLRELCVFVALASEVTRIFKHALAKFAKMLHLLPR